MSPIRWWTVAGVLALAAVVNPLQAGEDQGGCCAGMKAGCCAGKAAGCCTEKAAGCCGEKSGGCCAGESETCCPGCCTKEDNCCSKKKDGCCSEKEKTCCEHCCSHCCSQCCGRQLTPKQMAALFDTLREVFVQTALTVGFRSLDICPSSHVAASSCCGVQCGLNLSLPPHVIIGMSAEGASPLWNGNRIVWVSPSVTISGGKTCTQAVAAQPPASLGCGSGCCLGVRQTAGTIQPPQPVSPPLFAVPPSPPTDSHPEMKPPVAPGPLSVWMGALPPPPMAFPQPTLPPPVLPFATWYYGGSNGPATAPCLAYMPARPGMTAMTLKAVEEDGKTAVEVHSGDTVATCDHLVLKVHGASALKVCACEKQLHISGPHVEAAADRLTRSEGDGRLVLEGHVKMTCHKGETSAEVAAERVAVGLVDGSLEFEVGRASKGEMGVMPAAMKKEGEAIRAGWVCPPCPYCH